MAPGGFREICRTRGAWELRRGEVCTRADGRCEGKIRCRGQMVRCNILAPLHGTEEYGVSILAGEAHHLTKRKVRNDSMANLQWLCRRCHRAAEVPAKVVPKKEGNGEVKGMKTRMTLGVMAALVLLGMAVGVALGQQPAQTPAAPVAAAAKTEEVTPKKAVDEAPVKLAQVTEENLNLKAAMLQEQARQQIAPLQAQFADQEKVINDWVAAVKKENGWGDEVTLDRQKLATTGHAVWTRTAPAKVAPAEKK